MWETVKNKQLGVSKHLDGYTKLSQNAEKLRSDTSEAQSFWRWNQTRSLTSGSLKSYVMLCMRMKSYGRGAFSLLWSQELDKAHGSTGLECKQMGHAWIIKLVCGIFLSLFQVSIISLLYPMDSLACDHIFMTAFSLYLSVESLSQLPPLLIFVFISCKYVKYNRG